MGLRYLSGLGFIQNKVEPAAGTFAVGVGFQLRDALDVNLGGDQCGPSAARHRFEHGILIADCREPFTREVHFGDKCAVAVFVDFVMNVGRAAETGTAVPYRQIASNTLI